MITAGRIIGSNDLVKTRGSGLPHTFSHLFIDEAGQASECQALIPLAGLLSEGGQMVSFHFLLSANLKDLPDAGLNFSELAVGTH